MNHSGVFSYNENNKIWTNFSNILYQNVLITILQIQ